MLFDDVTTAFNLLLNLATLAALAWLIHERRLDRTRRRDEQVALMQKTRKVYQLGVVEGETRTMQNLVTEIGRGGSLNDWMATQLMHLNERSMDTAADESLLESVL